MITKLMTLWQITKTQICNFMILLEHIFPKFINSSLLFIIIKINLRYFATYCITIYFYFIFLF